MICSNCGKQLNESVNFCSGCGARLNGAPQKMRTTHESDSSVFSRMDAYERTLKNGMPSETVNADAGRGLLILALLATIFVGLAGILPIMQIGEGWFGSSLNSFDMFNYARELQEWVDNGYAGLLVLMLGISVICYIVSAIYGFIAILGFLSGKTGRYVTDPIKKAMVYGIVHLIIPMLLGFLFNNDTSDFLDGYALFTPTVWCWAILIVAFLNIFVFIKLYLEAIPSRRGSWSGITNDETAGDKRCIVCNKTFMIGNVCPACGSSRIRSNTNDKTAGRKRCMKCNIPFQSGNKCPKCGSYSIKHID